MPPTWRADGPGWLTRRGLLLLGLGTGTAAAGCTKTGAPTDGRTGGGRSPSPASRPENATPGPVASVDAERETELAALCAELLAGRHGAELTHRQRRFLESLREAHARHAAVVTGSDPAASSPGPTAPGSASAAGSASPPPTRAPRRSLAQSLALISEREGAALERYQRAARAATGSEAVLWGSLAVAARSYARILDRDAEGAAVRAADARPPRVVAEVPALQTLIRQLHAVLYGYQLALGRLPSGDPAHSHATDGLADVRGLRDRLTVTLIDRSAEVPAAEPAYVPPVTPRNSRTAVALLRHLDTALLPFCGMWLAAAANERDRGRALDTLSSVEARAAGWHAAPLVWPGWVA